MGEVSDVLLALHLLTYIGRVIPDLQFDCVEGGGLHLLQPFDCLLNEFLSFFFRYLAFEEKLPAAYILEKVERCAI